jgi:hypothetical protein
MVAPPVQDFDGAFQTTVVSEASTSPAAFPRTVPSPPKQRTNKRPPSASLRMRSGPPVRVAPGPIEGEAEMLA